MALAWARVVTKQLHVCRNGACLLAHAKLTNDPLDNGGVGVAPRDAVA